MKQRKRFALMLLAILTTAGAYIMVSQVAFTAKGPESPRNETRAFPGRAEAEAAVGYQLKEPKWLPPGWRVQDAVLSESYYASARSSGLKSVMLRFEGGGRGTHLMLLQTKSVTEPGDAGGQAESLQVQGATGTLSRGDPVKDPNLVVLSWNKAGLHFELVALLGDGLTFDDFVRIAESVG